LTDSNTPKIITNIYSEISGENRFLYLFYGFFALVLIIIFIIIFKVIKHRKIIKLITEEKDLPKTFLGPRIISDPFIQEIEKTLKEGYDLFYSGNLELAKQNYIRLTELYSQLNTPNNELYQKIKDFYNLLLSN
jgi:hypothetical protein